MTDFAEFIDMVLDNDEIVSNFSKLEEDYIGGFHTKCLDFTEKMTEDDFLSLLFDSLKEKSGVLGADNFKIRLHMRNPRTSPPPGPRGGVPCGDYADYSIYLIKK